VINKFNYKITLNNNESWIAEFRGKLFRNLSILAGAGINMKLCDKFLFDFQYNMYQSIEKNDGTLVGYSILGGLKYNF
jgi:opacity protein-like surface antigen